MNRFDQTYHELLSNIFDNGVDKGDRTGVGTRSLFGEQCKYNLTQGFPLLTTKKVHFKSVLHELLWFISGSTNVKSLQENGVKIWDEWADENGDLGPVYGSQWRAWPNFVLEPLETLSDGGGFLCTTETTVDSSIDQLAKVIDRIKTNPNCRRLIVTAWNPAEIDKMALPPCHCFFQFRTRGSFLDMQMYQRSCDVFLGVPFNIASYALLLEMVAQVTGYKAGVFTHTMGDVHIYNNHFDQVQQQLSRFSFEPPKLKINPEIKHIDDFKFEDFELINYKSHEAIKAPIAV